MSQPRNYQTEAIVIKKTKLGEADRILTLLTPYAGKVRAVAKGVRRPKSKMAGHLELLTHSQVSLAHGRNLETVTGSQTINAFLPLKSDLDLTSSGLYVAELSDQFSVEHQENREVFALLLATLGWLCQPNSREIVLRYFEMRLLVLTGYRPELQQCVNCHEPLQPKVNYFSFSAGGVLCSNCEHSQSWRFSLSVNALKVLRLLQKEDFALASKLRLKAELAGELAQVMQGYIRYILEREVKSAAFLDELRGMRNSRVKVRND
jgi:DNA repair protein RecO (recombination protein O)